MGTKTKQNGKKPKQGQEPWRNRIVGTGEEAPDQLLANPKNWRLHPKEQQEGMESVLDNVGWVQQVVVNKRTGFMVDGHLRVSLAMRRNEPRIPVLYVDLSPEEESIILATLDPIAAMASTDSDMLSRLLDDVETQDEGLQSLLDTLSGSGEVAADNLQREAENGKYSMKVATPVYEPKGEKPKVEQLFNPSKALELITRIKDAKIPDDVRKFLIHAAARHVVFDYRNIAEFYCHASKEVQELMEDSALVIVDFDKAIEDGYVELTQDLMKIYTESYGQETLPR